MTDFQPSLCTLANLAAKRGVLLAAILTHYQQRHQRSDAELASHLQMTGEQLLHLKLCEVPRTDHFDEDVERIAEHVHANAVMLSLVLREAESVNRLA